MNRYFKILILIVLIGSIGSFPILSSGQDVENPFQIFDQGEEFPPSSSGKPENNQQQLPEEFIQPDSDVQPEAEIISESEVENNASIFKTKDMVQVPESLPKQNIDAADFDDPFYRVR